MDRLRERVLEILKYHDKEIKVLENRIFSEKEALERDLDEIATSNRAESVCGGRPQKTAFINKRITITVEMMGRRRSQADEVIKELESEVKSIKEVETIIHTLDSRSKLVLLSLYYPGKTYDEVAELLQIDRASVYRFRKIAIENLINEVKKKNILNLCD